MNKIGYFIFLLSIGMPLAKAQQISGVVLDGRNDHHIAHVKVVDEASGVWTITDENGKFSIKSENGSNLIFSKTGWTEESIVVDKSSKNNITIKLFPATLRIPEVQIRAKKNKFSSIEIKEEALQKTQAFSLGDILQQLPGEYVKPLNNTEMKNIVLRTASVQSVASSSDPYDQDFGNKAFGTQIMVNDVALSNNSNMQNYNAANSNPFSTNVSANSFSVTTNKGNVTPAQANYGVDLRQISTDDIEKIEVIAGIPDAKYGDLTSGLIKIETKTGRRPLQIQTSLIEGTYQVGVSKGFEIDKSGDALNVSLNYMNAKTDPRFSDVVYERFKGDLLWSKTNKSKTWRNRFGFSFFSDINEGQAGEDEYHGIYVKALNKEFSLRNNTNLKFENKFINTANINLGLSYGEQNSTRRNFVNSQALPYGDSMENGVYYGSYAPPQYFNYNYVDGKPFNFFLDADMGGVFKTQNDWIHNVTVGINYRYSDNFGKGRYGTFGTFSSTATAGTASSGTRAYDFNSNVNSIAQFAGYVQDNIYKKFNNQSSLTINAGLRYDLQNHYSVLSPRLNASYKLKQFNLRGGVGLATKAPSLSMVYTGPRYVDLLLGDYRLPGVYSVAIVQTVVVPANNVDLKPSKSWRSELGFDLKFPFMTASFTGYQNKLYDGFTSTGNLIEIDKAKVQINQEGTTAPTFSVVGTEKYRYMQIIQTNGYESIDKGIEMMLGFEKIESLNLTIGAKGAYIHTKGGKNIETITASSVTDPQVAYGVLTPYKVISNLMRAGLSFDYHIPKAGLIVSINTDHFLIDSRENTANQLVGYLDHNLVRHEITPDILDNAAIKSLSNSVSTTEYFLNGKTFHNFHLRISKDFLSGLRISIYLNNMFNIKQYNSKGYEYTNFTPISFGGNMSYQF